LDVWAVQERPKGLAHIPQHAMMVPHLQLDIILFFFPLLRLHLRLLTQELQKAQGEEDEFQARVR
jgi:hypothetical protein